MLFIFICSIRAAAITSPEPARGSDSANIKKSDIFELCLFCIVPVVLLIFASALHWCSSSDDKECCGCLSCCCSDLDRVCEKCFTFKIPCCCGGSDHFCECLCDCHKNCELNCCLWCEIPICYDCYVCFDDHFCCC